MARVIRPVIAEDADRPGETELSWIYFHPSVQGTGFALAPRLSSTSRRCALPLHPHEGPGGWNTVGESSVVYDYQCKRIDLVYRKER